MGSPFRSLIRDGSEKQNKLQVKTRLMVAKHNCHYSWRLLVFEMLSCHEFLFFNVLLIKMTSSSCDCVWIARHLPKIWKILM